MENPIKNGWFRGTPITQDTSICGYVPMSLAPPMTSWEWWEFILSNWWWLGDGGFMALLYPQWIHGSATCSNMKQYRKPFMKRLGRISMSCNKLRYSTYLWVSHPVNRIITIYIIYNHLSFPRQKQGHWTFHVFHVFLRGAPAVAVAEAFSSTSSTSYRKCDHSATESWRGQTHGEKDLFEVADVDLVFNDVFFSATWMNLFKMCVDLLFNDVFFLQLGWICLKSWQMVSAYDVYMSTYCQHTVHPGGCSSVNVHPANSMISQYVD